MRVYGPEMRAVYPLEIDILQAEGMGPGASFWSPIPMLEGRFGREKKWPARATFLKQMYKNPSFQQKIASSGHYSAQLHRPSIFGVGLRALPPKTILAACRGSDIHGVYHPHFKAVDTHVIEGLVR